MCSELTKRRSQEPHAERFGPAISPEKMRHLDVRLDRITGEFAVSKQKLGRSLPEGEFLNSELGSAAKEIRQSRSRRYYEAWQQISPELEMGLTLGFSVAGPLLRISAVFVNLGTRGSEWSKVKEGEIKHFHDKWLNEPLGNPPDQFRWGKAISIVEPHWYSANVIIDDTRGG